MKLYFSTFALAILVAACDKSQYVPVPVDAPNRQKDHVLSKCLPVWNGIFAGTKGARTTIRMYPDRLNNLVMNEGTDKTWVIDGKGHNSVKNPKISYVAICRAFGDTQLNGVEVDGYKNGKPLFTITYIQNMTAGDQKGNAFDYSDVDDTTTPVEVSDTYIAVTK